MILLYAGRRAGSQDFPGDNTAFVGDQIERIVAGLRPRRVVGSAAAGTDLLVLEAASATGIPADVFLAGDRASFRAGSVTDRGEEWGHRFDTQLRLRSVTVSELPRGEDAEASYRRVTRRLAEHSEGLREAAEEVVVLAVSAPRDGGVDHTEELIADARARGRLVLRIDPRRREQDTLRGFVAMPFSTKEYPEQGWRRYDADLTYHRIMLPALIDGGYNPMRADTDALLEVIDRTMLREINEAEVMLVDLALLNANVMWELGVRHAWRRSGTILLAPDRVRSPFDVARVPLNPYRRTAQRIRDRDVVAAIRTLQAALAQVPDRRVDSPIFANYGALRDVELPGEAPGDAAETTVGDLLQAVTAASDLRRSDRLEQLARQVRAHAALPGSARTALLEQIGLALIALDCHADALPILKPLAEADAGFERRRLQEQYAHALIRAAEEVKVDEGYEQAKARLEAVLSRYGASGETYGLLGSAAKVRVERAAAAGRRPNAVDLEGAISAYWRGAEADPGDYYPGINAVALLRLRGQRWDGAEEDLRRARELLPVVRFAAGRDRAGSDDVWAALTRAECALHTYLLDGDDAQFAEARQTYTGAAPRLDARQRGSACRQLRLMRDAGDPERALAPLLALFG